jgi:proton-dependent oligopeptide transporter, POT family
MSSDPSSAKQRFPPQIKYIVGNEGCERFSFYGMSSILSIFMAKELAFAEQHAEAVFHVFVGVLYLMTLFGGWLSDRVLGRYKTILYLSFGYVAGHATIAAFEGEWGLYAGMALIAIGAGGIKPCVAAFMGDQFTREQSSLIDRAFSLFYFMINIGALAAPLVIPWLRKEYNAQVAFGLPGILMALALVIFVMGRKHYIQVPATGPNPNSFLKVVMYALGQKGQPGQHWLDAARSRFPEEAVEGAKAVIRISFIFLPVIIFWALFYQYGSRWVFQAEQMDLHFIWNWESSQIQFLNSFFVLGLLGITTYGVYPALKKRGFNVTPLNKMIVGMFVTVFSFVAAALVQVAIERGAHPNVAWQAVQYLLISLGEVLVSATALEFAYTQAPASMKSTLMGIWYTTIGLGSLLTALVAKLNQFGPVGFYVFFVVLMVVAAIVFMLIARRYRPVEFVPTSEAAQKAA